MLRSSQISFLLLAAQGSSAPYRSLTQREDTGKGSRKMWNSSGSVCSPGTLMFKPEPGLPKLYNPGQITQAYWASVSLFTKLKKEYITSRGLMR